MPLSVPASHGYRSTVKLSIQEQFFKHKFKPLTPTTQSGDGPERILHSVLIAFTFKCLHLFYLT